MRELHGTDRCVASILGKSIWGLGPLSPFYALSAAAARASCNRWMVPGRPASSASPLAAQLRQPALPPRGKARGSWLAEVDCYVLSSLCSPRIFFRPLFTQIDTYTSSTYHCLEACLFRKACSSHHQMTKMTTNTETAMLSKPFPFNLCPLRLLAVSDQPHRP